MAMTNKQAIAVLENHLDLYGCFSCNDEWCSVQKKQQCELRKATILALKALRRTVDKHER